MWLLHVWLDGMAAPFGLTYKSREAAVAARNAAMAAPVGETVEITDDYETEIEFDRGDLKAMVILSMARDCERQIDGQILTAKEQAKGQSKANADPGLALLQGMTTARGGLVRPQ